MSEEPVAPISRRNLLSLLGTIGGSAAMYQAMTTFGFAAESPYKGPIKLDGAARGTSVVILGAGLAGLTAAYELRAAGYKVQLLEYNGRVGGRSWTIRGGDVLTELGGAVQHCGFEKGLYMNPGPWRLAHHHRAILDYCRRLKVAVEPFVEVNYNGYLHAKNVLGGKPQRYRDVVQDFNGNVGELLAKATEQNRLDGAITKEDGEMLRQVLKDWAGLNKDFRYVQGEASSKMRGLTSVNFPNATKEYSQLLKLSDVLKLSVNAELWQISNNSHHRDLHNPLFQPVGGMDMIARAFGRELEGLVTLNAKVVQVQQDGSGVTVTYEDTRTPGKKLQAKADWCISTIPFSVLGQVDMQVSAPVKTAIDSISYVSSVKMAMQFKRRFWEDDDSIYGGFSHTDLPIRTMAYPSHGFNEGGKGVMYGAFMFGAYAYEFTGMTPEQRMQKALEYGSQIHPQYKSEFDNGISVAWHRIPFSLGCFARWNEELRDKHYQTLRAFDGRIAFAGEALANAVGGWQEGAILSSLDLIERLHARVIQK